MASTGSEGGKGRNSGSKLKKETKAQRRARLRQEEADRAFFAMWGEVGEESPF